MAPAFRLLINYKPVVGTQGQMYGSTSNISTSTDPIQEPNWKFWLVPTCLIFLVSLLYLPLEWAAREKSREEQSESLLRELSGLRGEIERTIFEETARIHGLAAVVRANPEITQQQFVAIARGIAGANHRIRNIAAARDLVITHMYPVKGNEKAVGLSYRDNAAQWPAVKNAIDQNALVIAGPVELAQGGTAFIARTPIFLPTSSPESSLPKAGEDTRLWGMISSVIDIDIILALAAPYEDRGINIALRGKDALGSAGEIFYGDVEVFEDADELMSISLPFGSWEIGARKITQGISNTLESWILRTSILLVCCAIFLSFSYRYRTLLRTVDLARKSELSERKYQALYENARDAIFIVDPVTRTIRDCNNIAASRLGYQCSELLNQPVSLINQDSGYSDRIMDEIGGSRKPDLEQIETVHLKKDGELMPVEITRSYIDFEGENLVLSIARDITDRKKQEHNLQAAHQRAEMANRSKSEFLANMSHELRTPLNAIIGFSEIMKLETFGKLGSAKYTDYVGIIKSSGDHLLSLINDILDLSKVEAGKIELNENACNIETTLKAAVRMIEIKAKEMAVAISCEVPADFPNLYADQRLLDQILHNALSNAVKFSPPGESIKICASLVKDGKSICLEISDNGLGMTDEELQHAMEPFHQVQDPRIKDKEGTGLGLPLMLALAELHDAELKIDSTKGVGTCIRLEFGAERTLTHDLIASAI